MGKTTFLSAATETYDCKKRNTYCGESLGCRNGQPCTRNTPYKGEHSKAEDEEDVAAQGGEDGCPSAALDALEIADHGDIDGKEEQVDSEEGHPLDGKGMGSGGILYEEAHQRFGKEND